MITIEEIDPRWWNDLPATEKNFNCPLCDAPHSFYYMTSMTAFCTACSKRIIDFGMLIDDEAYRLKYHFGIINDEGKRNHNGGIHKEVS